MSKNAATKSSFELPARRFDKNGKITNWSMHWPEAKELEVLVLECFTCIQANQTKESAGTHSSHTATQPLKGLSVDVLFTRIRSKNVARKKDFTGLNSETCWILLTDHFNLAVFGDTQVSKGSPYELNDHVFYEQIWPGSNASWICSSSKATNNALNGANLVAINKILVFTT
ncbi:hypothetical protein IV203_001619 [Nitzschia inconspicua]|uniref:Uncharacterized protein n=1 Tax=Nitzschia inconspicua TaxID=303405 RepID=A0A9K3L8X2_9STRA|nr:hypothetical protein IV203_001619 [Nitzschia inconspicua]